MENKEIMERLALQKRKIEAFQDTCEKDYRKFLDLIEDLEYEYIEKYKKYEADQQKELKFLVNPSMNPTLLAEVNKLESGIDYFSRNTAFFKNAEMRLSELLSILQQVYSRFVIKKKDFSKVSLMVEKSYIKVMEIIPVDSSLINTNWQNGLMVTSFYQIIYLILKFKVRLKSELEIVNLNSYFPYLVSYLREDIETLAKEVAESKWKDNEYLLILFRKYKYSDYELIGTQISLMYNAISFILNIEDILSNSSKLTENDILVLFGSASN